LARFGSKADFVPLSEPGSEAKNAATFFISSGLSCAAIAAMVAVGLTGPAALRVPSLNAFSCASR
jgi:hypothetical protein